MALQADGQRGRPVAEPFRPRPAGSSRPLQRHRQRNNIDVGRVEDVARVDAAGGAASSHFPMRARPIGGQ